jgi:hypothetical protein
MCGEVAGAVCLRPEPAGHPVAQPEDHKERKEYAPGPPVTQPPAALPAAGKSADSGLRPGRKDVSWHAPAVALLPGSVKVSRSLTRQDTQNWHSGPAHIADSRPPSRASAATAPLRAASASSRSARYKLDFPLPFGPVTTFSRLTASTSRRSDR